MCECDWAFLYECDCAIVWLSYYVCVFDCVCVCVWLVELFMRIHVTFNLMVYELISTSILVLKRV